MKKAYNQLIKAIEVTKKYSPDEVRLLSGLFVYLNNIDIDQEEFKTWVSAKWLWKLLNPLTRTWKEQPFREWWESVSNLARLKESRDFELKEIISKIPLDEKSFEVWEKSQTSKSDENKGRWWKRESYWIKEIDYILTLRAGEYCAVLTKWDAWDLYRRFIFDIKDEFLRLVFRYGKSIETRNEFTKSISKLEFMEQISEAHRWNIYWEMTNLIYIELFWVKAMEYKEKHEILQTEFAKHYFTKEWLFDLEKLEKKLWTIIDYMNPHTKEELIELIKDFLQKEKNKGTSEKLRISLSEKIISQSLTHK